jgi:hypothetical protein
MSKPGWLWKWLPLQSDARPVATHARAYRRTGVHPCGTAKVWRLATTLLRQTRADMIGANPDGVLHGEGAQPAGRLPGSGLPQHTLSVRGTLWPDKPCQQCADSSHPLCSGRASRASDRAAVPVHA